MTPAASRAVSWLALPVALATPVAGHGDGSFRCRAGRLVDVGMVDAVVLGRCGEPKSRTVEEVPVLMRNTRTNTVVRSGEITRIERWIYERGQGQFDAVLTFENGKLLRIELLTEP